MKNLLLIGSGQLGSRYIQGIIREIVNYNIIVVDSSKISLNNAKKYGLNRVAKNHFIKFFGAKHYQEISKHMILLLWRPLLGIEQL